MRRLPHHGGGRTLALVMGAKRLASIDTRTFRVSLVRPRPMPRPQRQAPDGGSTVAWPLVALPTLLLLGAAGVLAVRLRGQRQLGRGTLSRARDAAGRAIERTR